MTSFDRIYHCMIEWSRCVADEGSHVDTLEWCHVTVVEASRWCGCPGDDHFVWEVRVCPI